MPVSDVFYRLRIRTPDNTSDDLVVTTTRDGTNPYLLIPGGDDGQEIGVVDGKIVQGGYTAQIIDEELSPGVRVMTEKLADANGVYDILSRRAFIETSSDGSAWDIRVPGYLSRVQLVDALTFEATVGDSLRVDETRTIFAEITERFDRTISIIGGGPVRGDWGKLTDRGPWKMTVVSSSVPLNTVELQFNTGPLPTEDGGWRKATGGIDFFAATRINQLSEPYRVPRDGDRWYYPGLVARLEPVTPGSLVLATPVAHETVFVHEDDPIPPPSLVAGLASIVVEWPTGSLPSNGTQYFVYVSTRQISPESPLHIFDHPVDILTDLWDDAGIPYNAASAASVKALVGADVRLLLRIEHSYTLSSFEQSVIFLPFHIRFRTNTAGERVLFVSRQASALLPTTTIDTDDLLTVDEEPIFDLDEAILIDWVIVRQRRFTRWHPGFGDRPADDTLSFEDKREIESEVATGLGRTVEVDVPGTIMTSATGTDPEAFAIALAREIIPRFALGCPVGEIDVEDAVAAELGDFAILDIPHQVNGTVRGGQRIVQVIKKTVLVEGGVRLKLLDAGATAQASTVPTLSIAGTGKNLATVTITNTAALAAAGLQVRLEVGFGSSLPTSFGLAGIVDPGTVSTYALPRVDSGARVWVRARSERADQRPSAYSSVVDVDLTDLVAPSGLSRSGNVYSWTLGETDYPLRARVTQDGVTEIVAIMPAGSTSIDLTPFVSASTSVTFGLAHIDETPWHGISTEATDTYSTAAPTALATPVAPVAIRGNTEWGERFDGSIGMEATATEHPSSMEFEVAEETGVGSGVFGSFTRFAVRPTVVAWPTRATMIAPKDGKLRRFRARLVAPSRTASSYTSTIDVLPWSPTIRPPTRRANLPITDDTGTPVAYAAGANVAGELTHHIRGDAEVRAGTLHVEAAEDVAVGTIISPDEYDSDFYIPHSEFVQELPPGTQKPVDYTIEEITLNPSEAALNTITVQAPLVIPKGVTLVGIEFDARRDSTGCTATATVYRVGRLSGLSVLGTATHTGTGYSTSTLVLSETVGDNRYTIRVALSNNGVTGGQHAGFRGIRVLLQKGSYKYAL